jgi:hypothetical protein
LRHLDVRIVEVTDTRESSRPRWVEPTSLLRLRWGRYRARWITGLVLIIVGTGFVQLSSAYSLYFLLIGSLTVIAGWIIQPTAVWRRVAILLPALAGSWLLISGPFFSVCFAIPLAAWLIVRFRPAISYVVVLLPIAAGIVVGNIVFYESQSWISLSVGVIVTVAAAWLGRRLAEWAAQRRVRLRLERSISGNPGNLG